MVSVRVDPHGEGEVLDGVEKLTEVLELSEGYALGRVEGKGWMRRGGGEVGEVDEEGRSE